MFGEFEIHGQVKIAATIAIVIFLRYSALKEVEGMTTARMEQYHKLYINAPSSFYFCMTGFIFNTSLDNITIYTEGSGLTRPCDCVIYSVNNEGPWDIHLYTRNPNEMFEEVIFNGTSCGPLYLTVTPKTLILKYHGMKASSTFNTTLAAQIRFPLGQQRLHLQCSHNQFQQDDNWSLPVNVAPCDHVTTTLSSHVTTTPEKHVTNSKATVIKREMSKMSELQTILLAVLIPVVVIAMLILALLLWRRYKKKKGDGTVESDTIEVRTPKYQNAHLKRHNYVNVFKPGIIEVEQEAPHVYDNVVVSSVAAETKEKDDGLLYAQVVTRITETDSKAIDDVVL